jgi:hypothetical protein
MRSALAWHLHELERTTVRSHRQDILRFVVLQFRDKQVRAWVGSA